LDSLPKCLDIWRLVLYRLPSYGHPNHLAATIAENLIIINGTACTRATFCYAGATTAREMAMSSKPRRNGKLLD